jgi:hypothetical protein
VGINLEYILAVDTGPSGEAAIPGLRLSSEGWGVFPIRKAGNCNYNKGRDISDHGGQPAEPQDSFALLL